LQVVPTLDNLRRVDYELVSELRRMLDEFAAYRSSACEGDDPAWLYCQVFVAASGEEGGAEEIKLVPGGAEVEVGGGGGQQSHGSSQLKQSDRLFSCSDAIYRGIGSAQSAVWSLACEAIR
jgi:hypothetical protein